LPAFMKDEPTKKDSARLDEMKKEIDEALKKNAEERGSNRKKRMLIKERKPLLR